MASQGFSLDFVLDFVPRLDFVLGFITRLCFRLGSYFGFNSKLDLKPDIDSVPDFDLIYLISYTPPVLFCLIDNLADLKLKELVRLKRTCKDFYKCYELNQLIEQKLKKKQDNIRYKYEYASVFVLNRSCAHLLKDEDSK